MKMSEPGLKLINLICQDDMLHNVMFNPVNPLIQLIPVQTSNKKK